MLVSFLAFRRLGAPFVMAERMGFEPMVRRRTPAFQAGAFDRSATFPKIVPRERRVLWHGQGMEVGMGVEPTLNRICNPAPDRSATRP